MAVGYNPRAVTDGLVLALDAGSPKNYNAGISTNWTDKIGGNNGTLVNGTYHNDGPFVGAGYVEFDGSGDYLTVSSSTDFDFGSGDFTIEAWVYIAGNSPQNTGGNRVATIVNTWSNSFSGWLFIIKGDSSTTGTGLQFATWSSSNATRWNADLSISQQRWHHIAATVSGGTRQLFLNGTLLSGYTTTLNSGYTPANSLGNDLRIGRTTNTNNLLDLNGYISNLRIIKGTALYTSDFTPPTKPLTAITNTTLLTCQGNTITDASSSAHTITANGDAAANLGFPASAFEFDGTDDYVDLTQTIQFDTSDFSISGWFRSNSGNTSYKQIWSSGYNGGTPDVEIVVNQATNRLSFYVRPPGFSATTTYSVDDNVWRYFTATKTSSEISLYVNGSLVDSTSGSFTSDVDTAGVIPRIGNGLGGTNNRPFKGNIAQVSIYNRALTAAEVEQNYNATKGRYA